MCSSERCARRQSDDLDLSVPIGALVQILFGLNRLLDRFSLIPSANRHSLLLGVPFGRNSFGRYSVIIKFKLSMLGCRLRFTSLQLRLSLLTLFLFFAIVLLGRVRVVLGVLDN